MSAKAILEKLLAKADIQINGSRPWDIQVHNEGFYRRIISGGSIAMGESYMDGWWSSKQLDETMSRILLADLPRQAKNSSKTATLLLLMKFFNFQTKGMAKKVGKQHYDIGNDLYAHMLDKRMVYTCGYWEGAQTLDEAQEAKLDLVCRKIGLKPGMKVLDIGCGWGSFALFAAEKYGVSVIGVTISKEQAKLGQKLAHEKNLPVEIRLQDYRDVTESFDRIVSLGMFEHVGPKNYKTYMNAARKNLKDNGLFLLHTIGGKSETPDPWFLKYIFPNSVTPTEQQVVNSIKDLFVIEDWHCFGQHYDPTLMAWYKNFKENWAQIRKGGYDQRFYRMWEYYLLTAAGSFRSATSNLWQIVFSKKGVPGGYKSIR